MAVANQSHDHIAYALSKLNDDLIKQVAELRERGELPSDLAVCLSPSYCYSSHDYFLSFLLIFLANIPICTSSTCVSFTFVSWLQESFGYKYVDDVNSPYTFESPTPTPSLGFQRSGISSTSNNFGHQGHYDTAASGQSGSRGTIKESDYGQRQHRASQDSYEAAGATSTTVAAGRSHFSASEDGTDAHSGTLLPTGVGAAGGIGADSSLKRLGGAADGGLGLGLGVASGGGGVPGVVSASHLAGSVAVAGGSGNGQTTGPSSRSRNSPVQYHEPISEIIIEDLADGSAEEVFCVCKKVAFGEMVGCEAGEACLGGEWFHLDCVGLKYAPSGTWWCPTCKPKLPKKRRGA